MSGCSGWRDYRRSADQAEPDGPPYARRVPDRLPLFPLGMVLFPGLLLPLNVFEQRYRTLVQDLLALPEAQRQFGVVAIREGRESGVDGVSALYEVGCTAQVQRVAETGDGRYELVTAGARRFRLQGLLHDRPYLTGVVEWLPDDVGNADESALLARAVAVAFRDYLGALSEAGGGRVEAPELPDEPLLLSHLVAATAALDLAERQALLAEPDARARLGSELRLLRREVGLLRVVRALPSAEFTRGPVSPN